MIPSGKPPVLPKPKARRRVNVRVPDGYSFVREISSGGFGSVVEMIENATLEHSAGKIEPFFSERDMERIDREVNRLRNFAHPGIVKLKEVVSMEPYEVIVMELGLRSLAEIVNDYTERNILMPRDVVYRVMVDVSSALCFMHNHESGPTAYGDVRMEKILLFDGGHFKLCSFEDSERDPDDDVTSRRMMSYRFLSPERIESETGKATPESDLWALGIVLHWLLFGEPPYKSQNAARLIDEIGSFRVSMIGESCGREERALLMRMLDLDPLTRVTASELCSSGMLRCLVNSTAALWRVNEATSNELEFEHNACIQAEARSIKTQQPSPPRLATEPQFWIGAEAIELFDQTRWTEYKNVFTNTDSSLLSLLSFEFGAVVARLTLIIRNGPSSFFPVGIISSSLSTDALTNDYSQLKGGAGWELDPTSRSAKQNNKMTHLRTACSGGEKGQRVVLEADGREGKRTLKLSQDGVTQPVFFTNIPVPFRFAVCITEKNDSVEIVSVDVVTAPMMIGGTIHVRIDD
ncbi:putative Protein kinase domain containing protein [Blattamonas nauphoetae]|uniref:Protein kinase domain-containing protein n=1 Tax=Blattamonas nauphoetae TaxID=2049346 RepID=A0ABQ9WZ52_9EUKA|nr:putative Protein kinase domain containing protein [Blattamonas nauphoetae]